MPEPVIHIARDEAELGTFPLSEARELMHEGFFRPDDDAWAHGMAEWGRLGETVERLTAAGGDWRDKVIVGAGALSRVVGRRMGRVVARVKAQAVEGQDGIASARRRALEHYLPRLQKLLAEYLRNKPASVTRAALHDEAAMRKTFGALYDCLPKPLCRFVSEGAFITFCMEHRQRLLGGGPDSPDAPTSSASDDAPRA